MKKNKSKIWLVTMAVLLITALIFIGVQAANKNDVTEGNYYCDECTVVGLKGNVYAIETSTKNVFIFEGKIPYSIGETVSVVFNGRETPQVEDDEIILVGYEVGEF